jgi:hypothetical protein
MILSLDGNAVLVHQGLKFSTKYRELRIKYDKVFSGNCDLMSSYDIVTQMNVQLKEEIAKLKAEINKWKSKAVEVSLNAQKIAVESEDATNETRV